MISYYKISIEHFNNNQLSIFVSTRLFSSVSKSINICPRISCLALEKPCPDLKSPKTVSNIIQTTTDPEVSSFYNHKRFLFFLRFFMLLLNFYWIASLKSFRENSMMTECQLRLIQFSLFYLDNGLIRVMA